MTDEPEFYLILLMLGCVVGGAALAFVAQGLVEMFTDYRVRRLRQRMGEEVDGS